MRYEEYNVEDFLFDEFFVKWIKNPGPETQHFWETWIQKNPQKIDTINKARELVLSVGYKNRYEPTDKEYNEVLENILRQPASFTQFDEIKKNDRLSFIVKLVAVLIILGCVSVMIVYMKADMQVDVALQTVQLIERENPNGQKATFDLGDGTIVKLNAGSKLIYDEQFTGAVRKVYLEGEAFFEVKRDENKPFIVETKDLVTRVLGTSFNVKSYNGEDNSFVAVETGEVKVSTKNADNSATEQQYLLTRHQMAIYDTKSNSVVKKEHISDDVFVWKDNIILFDHHDFDHIISKLTRWYGVEFVVANNRSFEGRFNAEYENESLEMVLNGLKGEYSFNYRMEENGKKIYIY